MRFDYISDLACSGFHVKPAKLSEVVETLQVF